MKYLFDSTRQRQLSIINILYDNKRNWVPIDELAQTAKCSSQTIKSDLKSINENYQKFVTIEITSKAARAKFTHGVGYVGFQRTVMQESNTHKLLEIIFFNKDLTIEQASRILDVSESTIYRLVQQINPSIRKHYNIKLLTQPLTFQGDEKSIQGMYINFFSEKYHPFQWPFEGYLIEKNINSLVDIIIKATGFKLEYDSFRYLKFAISVALIRNQQGYSFDSVKISTQTKQTLEKISDMIDEGELGLFYQDKPLSKSGLKNFSNLFGLFLDSYHNFAISKNYVANWQLDKVSMSDKRYTDIFELTTYIENKYNLNHPEKNIFVNQLLALASLNLANLGVNSLFFDHYSPFNKGVEKLNKDLYNDVRVGIENFVSKYNLNQQVISYLIQSFYTYWPQLTQKLYQLANTARGIVISYYEIQHARTQADMLNLYMGNLVKFDVWQDYHFNEETLSELEEDIIIADFTLPQVPGKLVYTLEHIPSYKDAWSIYTSYQEILKNQED